MNEDCYLFSEFTTFNVLLELVLTGREMLYDHPRDYCYCVISLVLNKDSLVIFFVEISEKVL